MPPASPPPYSNILLCWYCPLLIILPPPPVSLLSHYTRSDQYKQMLQINKRRRLINETTRWFTPGWSSRRSGFGDELNGSRVIYGSLKKVDWGLVESVADSSFTAPWLRSVPPWRLDIKRKQKSKQQQQPGHDELLFYNPILAQSQDCWW